MRLLSLLPARALPAGGFAMLVTLILFCAGCGGGGGSITVVPGAPSVPENLAGAPGNAQVALTWNLSPGATLYNVYRDDAPGANHLLKGGLAQTTFTDTGLTNGQTYHYEVTAQNTSGESTKSSPLSVVLPIAFTFSISPPTASLDNAKTQTFTAPLAGNGTDPAKVTFSLQNATGQTITDGSAGTLGATKVTNGVPTVVYTAPSPNTAQTYFVVASYPGQTAQKAVVTVGAGSGGVVIPIQ